MALPLAVRENLAVALDVELEGNVATAEVEAVPVPERLPLLEDELDGLGESLEEAVRDAVAVTLMEVVVDVEALPVDVALDESVPDDVTVLPLLRVGERVPIAVALPVPVGVPLGAALVVAVALVLLEEVPLRVGAEAEADEVLVIDMGPDVVTLEVAVAEVGALGVADSEAPLLGDAVEVHVSVVVLLPVELDVVENVAAAEALPSGLPVPELLPVAEVVAVIEGGGDTVGELEGEPLELAVEDEVPVAAADAL